MTQALSDAYLALARASQRLAELHAPASPPWLERAMVDLADGLQEIPGAEAHPRIAKALALTRHPSRSDETAWCSAAVCLWMHEVGLPHTHSAAARSWLGYGEPSELRRGAVVVLWRGSPASDSGHVGLVERWNTQTVWVLGGNQGNKVSIQGYPRSRILGVRWPQT